MKNLATTIALAGYLGMQAIAPESLYAKPVPDNHRIRPAIPLEMQLELLLMKSEARGEDFPVLAVKPYSHKIKDHKNIKFSEDRYELGDFEVTRLTKRNVPFFYKIKDKKTGQRRLYLIVQKDRFRSIEPKDFKIPAYLR